MYKRQLRNLVGAYAIKDDEAGHFTLKDDTDTYEYAYNLSLIHILLNCWVYMKMKDIPVSAPSG